MQSQVLRGLGESSMTIRFALGPDLTRGGTMLEQADGNGTLDYSYVRRGHNSQVKSKTNPVQSERCLAVSQSKSWSNGKIQY